MGFFKRKITSFFVLFLFLWNIPTYAIEDSEESTQDVNDNQVFTVLNDNDQQNEESISSSYGQVGVIQQDDLGNGKSADTLVDNSEINPVVLGIDATILETFPDSNLAQAVVEATGAQDVNSILTPELVNGTHSLNASSSNISDLTGIEHLVELRTLFLSNNMIAFLPDTIGNLVNLERLSLDDNQLKELPDTIGNLTNLSQLSLNFNSITDLPNSIGNLTNLYYLDISSNRLSRLPDSIGNLGNLSYLLANFNSVEILPSTIGNLANLIELNLSGNKLTVLPNGFEGLVSLQKLSLDLNELATLPDSISKLSNLRNLWLGGNQLSKLDDTIGNLANIAVLSLENNRLTNLPNDFWKLSNLVYVNLSNNELTSLPETMSNFQGRLSINLQDNLLPTDYHIKLIELGVLPPWSVFQEQKNLGLNGNASSRTIRSQTDFESLDLFTFVNIEGSAISPTHQLFFENFVDAENNPVELSEYIQNGNVIKEGSVFVQVRAGGVGIFSNNSDHAITSDKLELIFVKNRMLTFQLKFNLNGGEGEPPVTQLLKNGEAGEKVADPKRTGYTFSGWNTKEDGTGVTWTPGITPMSGQDTTLYAQWSKSVMPSTPNDGQTSNQKNPVSNKVGAQKQKEIPMLGEKRQAMILLGFGLLLGIVCFWKESKRAAKPKS